MALYNYDQNSPGAVLDYNAAGITPDYNALLMNLGYRPNAFASKEGAFKNQIGFQQLMKRIMDQRMKVFEPYSQGYANPVMALPQNMENYMNMARTAYSHPLYSLTGADEFFQGGWKSGDFPHADTPTYAYWRGAVNNYPNVPPPITSGGGGNGGDGGGGGGGGQSQSGTQLYNVPIIGPDGGVGTIQVVAHDPQSAVQNAHQGGNTPTGGAVLA